MLTRRLVAVTEWMMGRDLMGRYSFGYFGAHMGAAAAIQAAVGFQDRISAIVCRSGWLELVTEALNQVEAATLLIAGGLDRYVMEMNREALESLPGDKELEIIPGATHLFEGEAIREVADLAAKWFAVHLQHTAVAIAN